MELTPDHLVPAEFPSPKYSPPMSRPVVSSRKARTEQKKLVSQIFLFGGGAIALLLAFIFIIAPGAIRLVGGLFGGSTTFTVDDTLPPQVPVLAAPAPATFSAQVSLTGYGEVGSKVTLLLNGQPAQEITLPEGGQFTQEIALTEGDNQVSAYATDEAGNESAESTRYNIVLDTEAPSLEIAEPQDGQQIELRKNQNLTIKGTTEPRARLYINGRLALANDEGAFSSTYLLSEGENKLEFKAQDQAGNVTEKTITVQFKF